MMDLGKALEENKNHFFAKKQLKYFENMPELQNGYPGVILFSLLVVAGLIFLCKRKNIF